MSETPGRLFGHSWLRVFTKQCKSCFATPYCFAVVLIAVLQTPGCDLTGGPAKVQKRTETQLRQYFPNGRAVVLPKQETIAAVTCTYGLGKPVIEVIGTYLGNLRGIQQLHEARNWPLKLSPYRFVTLEFDEYYIRLDTDTNQHWITPSDSQAHLEYEVLCGTQAATRANAF